MINTVNIDLTNSSCWGTANEARTENDNKILLYIKLLESLLEKTDIYLEFTKPDGVIITTENLTINNGQVNYEIPFNLYVTAGTLKLRVLATNYSSDYINFNILNAFTETDDICVKYNSTTAEFNISKCKTENIVDKIYPIGSIYMSVNNIDPSSLFGGTWERIKDRFLLSAGDTYKAGDSGGEATHILTINEMPSHKHKNFVGQGDGGGTYSNNLPESAWTDKTYWNYYETEAVGGGQAHNNMPPYLAVYVWKRTA